MRHRGKPLSLLTHPHDMRGGYSPRDGLCITVIGFEDKPLPLRQKAITPGFSERFAWRKVRRMIVDFIYHLARAADWQAALQSGWYEGAAEDRRDGFLHFSTAQQITASADRHRAGEAGLVLLEIAIDRLPPPEHGGGTLKWEASPSRGALFPHLYGRLAVAAVTRVADLPLEADHGVLRHAFPAWYPFWTRTRA